MEDKELIREIQRGKKQYLNDIAAKYYDDIYRFCCYQTGNKEQSYDLAQETFLKFVRYVDHYHYQNLKGYLLTIARNVCIDYFRSQKQDAVTMDAEDLERIPGTLQVEDMKTTTITLVDALKALNETQREAILLFYYQNLKYREIAKITGANLSTVKSRIKQGTEKLQKVLRKEDFYGSAF
ncbi:MAG: RNA polymerase sigma factor [bacterium]|nr:RNA polymerase sigma factor [bacterium]